MLIRGIECLSKLGGHIVERTRASIDRGIDGIVCRLKRFFGIIDAAFGMFHELLRRLINGARLLEHAARRYQ